MHVRSQRLSSSSRLISPLFHINRSIHSRNTTTRFPKCDFENKKIQCQVMVEVEVQGCIVGPTSCTTHTPLIHSCRSALPFLRYGYSKYWPWKSKVKFKVMGQVKVQSHKGRPFLSTHIPFVPCQSAIPFRPIPGIPIPSIGRPIPGIRLIQNLILKTQGQGQGHGWGERSWSHN